ESIMALHELEAMQEDLTKLFDERFEDLSNKIEALRTQVGVEIKESIEATQITTPQIEVVQLEKPAIMKASAKRSKRKPQKTRKTAAEERIEKIRSEVEKVLDRLEQMEAED
ncbi:MAG: hypothetical protein NWF11_02105, partial [Candidatus Bathyarchaeota archaeon]|nr:hypothetical protein [Candidatus Bathyarchaeota archaeon]